MLRRRSLVAFVLATGTTLAVPSLVFAQTSAGEPRIVPIEWPRPVYPQIAQSARVQGQVEVAIDVRPDGGISAVQVVRGIPLLDQAVLDAVRRARFECRGCVDPVSRYSIYVTFRLGDTSAVSAPLIVSPTQGWLTVVAPVPMINGGPGVPDPPTRGLKCLFLWRCDPPATRARDGHCLWLWRCGHYYTYM